MQVQFNTFGKWDPENCNLKYIQMKRIFLISILCLGTMIIVKGQEQQAKQLLSEAIYQEEVNGELDEAITSYQFIIKQYPENRKVAAEALLHLGLCYEKKGMQEAGPAYRQLIEDYPDQKKEVTTAKERLSKFLKLSEKTSLTALKPTFRKISIPIKPGNGVLSPDGENMAFTSQGAVWIVPVQGKVQPDLAGEPKRITEPMEASNFSNHLAWSGDGKWIAFNATDNEKDAIYIVSSTGGEPKKIPVNLIRSGGGAMYDYRLSLSHDGNLLAFSSSDINLDKAPVEKELPRSIYVYSMDDGTITHLTGDNTGQPAFSPDGKMIAYVKNTLFDEGYPVSEGWVIPVNGGPSYRISEPAVHLTGPIWSPDGRMIGFTSRKDPEHSNINQVVIVSISEDGKTVNTQKVINLPNYTFLISAGWSRNNTIGLHLVNPRFQAIYTVPFPGGNATQVTPDGYANNPCWTADGKRILYRWEDVIRSIPEKGGETSAIQMKTDVRTYEVLPGGGNHISPDGKRLLFAGYIPGQEKEIRVHLMVMPVEGGIPEVITQSPTQDRFPCWSPDGKSIAFIRYHGNSKGNIAIHVFTVPAEGGDGKQITLAQDSVHWSSLKYTPDGKHIAYYSRDKSIKLIPVHGGESKELVKVESLDSHNEILMLKDGKHMAYTSGGKIWMVSLQGGDPVQIETGLDDWYHSQIDQSPDGKTIAFTAFTGGDSDLWLMENFLPESTVK
jgi:Tol biopolymer transport system component